MMMSTRDGTATGSLRDSLVACSQAPNRAAVSAAPWGQRHNKSLTDFVLTHFKRDRETRVCLALPFINCIRVFFHLDNFFLYSFSSSFSFIFCYFSLFSVGQQFCAWAREREEGEILT